MFPLVEDILANCRSGSGGYDGPSTINFGQKPFKFPPPDGYQPLNAANVRPETVIARPDQYVGVTTYTGSAPTAQQITDLNFGTNQILYGLKIIVMLLDIIMVCLIQCVGPMKY